MTQRTLLASNAQAAIISNADTCRELTKAVKLKTSDEEKQLEYFFMAVAAYAVGHADALLKELNETK